MIPDLVIRRRVIKEAGQITRLHDERMQFKEGDMNNEAKITAGPCPELTDYADRSLRSSFNKLATAGCHLEKK